jgi:predicted ATPase
LSLRTGRALPGDIGPLARKIDRVAPFRYWVISESASVASSMVARGPTTKYVPPMQLKPSELEQHIAVFGESGSGKTVLVSSFYGAMQEPHFLKSSLFDVTADDTG